MGRWKWLWFDRQPTVNHINTMGPIQMYPQCGFNGDSLHYILSIFNLPHSIWVVGIFDSDPLLWRFTTKRTIAIDTIIWISNVTTSKLFGVFICKLWMKRRYFVWHFLLCQWVNGKRITLMRMKWWDDQLKWTNQLEVSIQFLIFMLWYHWKFNANFYP